MTNTNQSTKNQPSALGNILNAGASGMASPSAAAQIAAGLRAPPGAENAYAQGAQAAWNMGVAGSREMMAGTIRQQGRSPSVALQDMKIKQSISQSAPNKGIEAARQKMSAKQSATTQTGQSTNQGIKSFQNKTSGQASSNSSGATKTASQGQSR